MSEEIHDGDRVQAVVSKLALSERDFAEKMELSRSTIRRLVKKAHWPSNYLRQASLVLETNFFQAYSKTVRLQKGILLFEGENGMEAYSLEKIEELGADELHGIIVRLKQSK